MKQQINEIRRMQQLAGLISEVNYEKLQADVSTLKDVKEVEKLIPTTLQKVKGKTVFEDQKIKSFEIAPATDEEQTVLMIRMESGKVMFMLVWIDLEKFPVALKARIGKFDKGGLSSKEPSPEDSSVFLEILKTLYPNSDWNQSDVIFK